MGQRLNSLGKMTAAVLKTLMAPQVGREDICDSIGYIENAGTPDTVVPDFIGQVLFDTTGLDWYRAFGVAAGEWAPSGINTVTLAEMLGIDGLLATSAELNRATDVSTRIVVLTATGAITEALHEGKTCLLAEVGGDAAVTLTLPAATGSGGRYRFVVDVVNTSGYTIKAAAGADVFNGSVMGNDGAAVTTAWRWHAGATDDTFIMNGTTTGGVFRGDWVEFEDVSATGWVVRGDISQSGAEATPFSDTVA